MPRGQLQLPGRSPPPPVGTSPLAQRGRAASPYHPRGCAGASAHRSQAMLCRAAPGRCSIISTKCHCNEAAAAEREWEMSSCQEGLESPGHRRGHGSTAPAAVPSRALGQGEELSHSPNDTASVPFTPCGPGKGWQWRGSKGHDGHEQHRGHSCPVPAAGAVPGISATTPGGTNHGATGWDPVGTSPHVPGATVLTFHSGP